MVVGNTSLSSHSIFFNNPRRPTQPVTRESNRIPEFVDHGNRLPSRMTGFAYRLCWLLNLKGNHHLPTDEGRWWVVSSMVVAPGSLGILATKKKIKQKNWYPLEVAGSDGGGCGHGGMVVVVEA